MKNCMLKLSVILLLVAMLVPLFMTGPVVSASAASDSASSSLSTSDFIKLKRKEKDAFYKENLDQIQKKLDDLTPEEKKWFKDGVKEATSLKTVDSALGKSITAVYKILDTNDESERKNLVIDAVCGVINIAASCFSLGGISEALTGIIGGELKDPVPSEMELLQNHVDEKFEEVNKNFLEVKESISNLSNKMNETVASAVSELSGVIRATESGRKAYTFLSGGEGNFSYWQFKNYFYGAYDDSNPLAETAYAGKLSKLQYDACFGNLPEGEYEEVLEEYYNAIYCSLMTIEGERSPYFELFREYVFAEGQENSIQRDYYDWLLMGDTTAENAEWEALRFVQDLYLTMLTAEHYMLLCNNYFTLKIIEEYGPDASDYASYTYTSPAGDVTYVRYGDLKKQFAFYSSEERDIELCAQMLDDIAYILNMKNSYVIETEEGEFYEKENINDTFANVYTGQTVYLNRLPDEFCKMFALDPQKITYLWSYNDGKDKTVENDGILTVPANISSLSASLCYEGRVLDTVTFHVNSGSSFAGGTGTAEDPYLIANGGQFKRIAEGLDKHYRLIADVDFRGIQMAPIGSTDKPFTGTLNGNGFSVTRITISSTLGTVGIFAANFGQIENITFQNCTVRQYPTDAEAVCGLVAGKNEGTIRNCTLVNCDVSSERVTNATGDLSTYLGGIVGKTSGTINYCKIESTNVVGLSQRNYNSNHKKTDNSIYVGGIAGKQDGAQILNCVVLKGTGARISATAKTYCDEFWKKTLHHTAIAGGIVPSHNGNIKNVFVNEGTNISATVDRENRHDVGGSSPDGECSKYTYAKETIGSVNSYGSVIKAESANSITFPTVRNATVATAEQLSAGTTNAEYACSEHILYNHSEDFLKTTYAVGEETKELYRIRVNGKAATSYKILSYYGLDTDGSTRDAAKRGDVTALVEATVDGKTVLRTVKIPFVAKKPDAVLEVVKAPSKQQYDPGEAPTLTDTKYLEGGEFELVYADGTRIPVTPDSMILTPVISEETGKWTGEYRITVSYGSKKATYAVDVYCAHTYGETFAVPPTCTEDGYTAHTCTKCHHVEVIAGTTVPLLGHTPEKRSEKATTCYEEGYTGDDWCAICDVLLAYGEAIAIAPHSYAEVDATSHKCDICDAIRLTHASPCHCKACEEAVRDHEYYSIETEESIVYTCASCGYSPDPIEKKPDTAVARVVVGNSYGLINRRDEIAVYVKIFENPGITGVSFRIDFDKRLEFVGFEKGEVLLTAKEFSVANAEGVIGFVAANAREYTEDGGILKLIFKLPADATLKDLYDIRIACTPEQFTNNAARPIEILTFAGSIKPVSHLPGDVNNDEVVDLLDTALVARYMAIKNTNNTPLLSEFLENENYDFSEFHADVNLDGKESLSDLVIMLQYFIGINTIELTSNEFDVVLNPNGGELDEQTVTVKRYDGEGNHAYYPVLSEPTRPGYRFDGWYHSFDVKDLEAERVDETDFVVYNTKLLKQTLYAHWTEIYTVEFNLNAHPDASEILDDEMEKQQFARNESAPLSGLGFAIRGWTFCGWADEPGGAVVFADAQKVVDLAHASETVELYAVWRPNTYTVHFDKNTPTDASEKISGTMDDVLCTYDTSKQLFSCDYGLNGWRFIGWSTSRTGTVEYADEDVLLNLTETDGATVTFYAVWRPNTYTVHYHPNGGTGTMESSSHEYDVESTLYANSFRKDEYTFGGWNTQPNGSGKYFADLSVVVDLVLRNGGEITLYAQWLLDSYIVYYDPNGGMGEMPPTVCEFDATVPLDQNKFEREGYAFAGWNTRADGCGIAYTDLAEVINLANRSSGAITLYAQWKSYIVTFDPNVPAHATAPADTMPSVNFSPLADATLPANVYKISGWIFCGWALTPNGEAIYADGATVSPLGDADDIITLYAVWEEIHYISFDANVPDHAKTPAVTMDDMPFTYGESQELPKNRFVIPGWSFAGWATSPTGVAVYLDGATVQNLTATDGATVTLYAVWKVDPLTVSKNVINPISSSVDGRPFEYYTVSDTDGENSYTVYIGIENTPWSPDARSIIDWSGSSADVATLAGKRPLPNWAANSNRWYHMDIYSDDKEVYFIGDSSKMYTAFRITVCQFQKDQELALHFVNFNFCGDGNAISLSECDGIDLTIEVIGTCAIGTNEKGATVLNIPTADLTVTGSGTLDIYGGHGANGSSAGASGQNGGTGIVANNITVGMTGSLFVYGGNGGNGAAGSNGNNGSGNDAPGGNGGKGGNGGIGASAIKCTSITVSDFSTVILEAGTGGQGGQGGKGGNGTRDKWPFSAHNGIGGKGGNGGNGGSCANPLDAKNISGASSIVSHKGVVGSGGVGGNGGNGGAGSGGGSAGGSGGAGGWSGDGKVQAKNGTAGTKGTAG